MQASRQCRRARGVCGGAPHGRHADRPDPAGLSRKGKLFQLQRAGAVFTPDLSGAGARRARGAPDPRHGGTRPGRAQRFYPAPRRYWPALPDGALMPSYSGIRPKIVPPAVAVQDFLIQGPRDHGIDGLINLFGIESPGLTSSLAIADYVGELAGAVGFYGAPSRRSRRMRH